MHKRKQPPAGENNAAKPSKPSKAKTAKSTSNRKQANEQLSITLTETNLQEIVKKAFDAGVAAGLDDLRATQNPSVQDKSQTNTATRDSNRPVNQQTPTTENPIEHAENATPVSEHPTHGSSYTQVTNIQSQIIGVCQSNIISAKNLASTAITVACNVLNAEIPFVSSSVALRDLVPPKIWKGEFVDMGSLKYVGDETFIPKVSKDSKGQPLLQWEEKTSHKFISINQWSDNFNIFTTVYCK